MFVVNRLTIEVITYYYYPFFYPFFNFLTDALLNYMITDSISFIDIFFLSYILIASKPIKKVEHKISTYTSNISCIMLNYNSLMQQ